MTSNKIDSQKIIRGSVTHDDQKPKNVSIPSKFETILGIGKKETDGFNSRTYRFDSEETEVPGPGHYEKPVMTDVQALSYAQHGYSNIMNKEKRWYEMPGSVYNFPGPGAYHTPDFVSEMSKKTVNKVHGTAQFAPKFVPLITKKKETPGPGAYRPEESTSLKPKDSFQRKDYSSSGHPNSGAGPFNITADHIAGPNSHRSPSSSVGSPKRQYPMNVNSSKLTIRSKPKPILGMEQHVKSASIPNDRGVAHEGAKFKRPQPTEEETSDHDPKTNRENTTQQTDVGGIRPPSPVTSESTHYDNIGEIGFETRVRKFKHQPIDEQLPNAVFRSVTKREIPGAKLVASNPGPGTYELPGAINLKVPRKGKASNLPSNTLPMQYTKQIVLLQQQEQQKALLQATKQKNPGVGQYELLNSKDFANLQEKKAISSSFFLSNSDRFGKKLSSNTPPSTKYNVPIEVYKKKSFRVTMGPQKTWNPT